MESSCLDFSPQGRLVDLPDMVALVDGDSTQLGNFEWVAADTLPKLGSVQLNHNDHMTVSVESFHGSPVSVEVLKQEPSTMSTFEKSCSVAPAITPLFNTELYDSN